MIFIELKKYLKSKVGIVGFLFCFIPAIVSYYFTYMSKINLELEIARNPADLNIENSTKFLKGINGITYLISYFSSTDYFIICFILMLLFIGVVLCGTEIENRLFGKGNFIYSRITIVKGMFHIIIAQSIYIIIFVSLYFAIMIVGTVLMFPVTNDEMLRYTVMIGNPTLSHCIFLLMMQMLHLIVILIFIVAIAYVVSIWIKNIYIAYIVPFLFEIVPYILAAVFYNFNKSIFDVINKLIPDNSLLYIFCRYSWSTPEEIDNMIFDWTYILTGIIVYFILFIIFSFFYVRKVRKAYL